MRPSLLHLALILLLPLAISCDESKSQRCQDVCQKETDCAEGDRRNGESFPYDLDECIAACVGLERDINGRKKVDDHVLCVERAGDTCSELMKCQQLGQ